MDEFKAKLVEIEGKQVLQITPIIEKKENENGGTDVVVKVPPLNKLVQAVPVESLVKGDK